MREHRGWILQQYLEEGPEFLKRVAIIERVSALYGVSRLVLVASVGFGKVLFPTLKNLRQKFVQMQAQATMRSLLANVNRALSSLEQMEQEFLAAQGGAKSWKTIPASRTGSVAHYDGTQFMWYPFTKTPQASLRLD